MSEIFHIFVSHKPNVIDMNLIEAMQLAHKHMVIHGLIEKGWCFEFNRRKTAYGMCYSRRKIIYLSKVLTLLVTEEACLNTIIHEIAHALTPGHHHDAVWRAKFLSMGGNGKRCGASVHSLPIHTLAKPFFKFKGQCPTCKKVIQRNRRTNVSCGKCSNGTYNTTHRIVYTLNVAA